MPDGNRTTARASGACCVVSSPPLSTADKIPSVFLVCFLEGACVCMYVCVESCVGVFEDVVSARALGVFWKAVGT